MKTLPASLATALRALDRERMSRVPHKALVAMVGIMLGIAILVTFAAGVPILPWVLVFIASLVFGWVASIRRDVALSFKRRVLPPLIAELDPSLEYSPGGMPEEEFRSYQLYETPDRYASKDLVHGTVGRTALRFALVHAEKQTGWGKNKRYKDLFKGLLFVARFHKRVRGTTRVASGEAWFFEELSADHVELENPDFDDRFRVRSTDQVEARFILTPDMQERFVALRGQFDDVNAVFFDDKVAIALEVHYDFLEPDVDSRFDLEQVQQVFSRLRLLVGIVEALDLNTRIWTVK